MEQRLRAEQRRRLFGDDAALSDLLSDDGFRAAAVGTNILLLLHGNLLLATKKPFPPQNWDERQTFRGTTRIRVENTHLTSGNGGGNRPALAGRSRANQATPVKAAFSR